MIPTLKKRYNQRRKLLAERLKNDPSVLQEILDFKQLKNFNDLTKKMFDLIEPYKEKLPEFNNALRKLAKTGTEIDDLTKLSKDRIGFFAGETGQGAALQYGLAYGLLALPEIVTLIELAWRKSNYKPLDRDIPLKEAIYDISPDKDDSDGDPDEDDSDGDHDEDNSGGDPGGDNSGGDPGGDDSGDDPDGVDFEDIPPNPNPAKPNLNEEITAKLKCKNKGCGKDFKVKRRLQNDEDFSVLIKCPYCIQTNTYKEKELVGGKIEESKKILKSFIKIHESNGNKDSSISSQYTDLEDKLLSRLKNLVGFKNKDSEESLSDERENHAKSIEKSFIKLFFKAFTPPNEYAIKGLTGKAKEGLPWTDKNKLVEEILNLSINEINNLGKRAQNSGLLDLEKKRKEKEVANKNTSKIDKNNKPQNQSNKAGESPSSETDESPSSETDKSPSSEKDKFKNRLEDLFKKKGIKGEVFTPKDIDNAKKHAKQKGIKAQPSVVTIKRDEIKNFLREKIVEYNISNLQVDKHALIDDEKYLTIDKQPRDVVVINRTRKFVVNDFLKYLDETYPVLMGVREPTFEEAIALKKFIDPIIKKHNS